MEFYIDLREVGFSDDINKFVSYVEVYNVVKDIIENK